MPFDQPWGAAPSQRETTTATDLPSTLRDMLPVNMSSSQQVSSLEGLTSPSPWDPYGHDTWQSVAQKGLPMAGGMLGSAAGPLGAGAGASLGEAGAELLTGQPLSPTRIGLSGALSAGGAMAGRALSGVSRIAETGVRNSPAAQALGVRAPYATGDSQDVVSLDALKSTVDNLSSKWNAIVPSTVRPVPTQAGKLVSELDELKDILATSQRPLSEVTTIRRLIGTFIEGNKTLPEAKALYGALMSDLRQAAPQSPDVASYLHDLGNDKIVRSLFPENMLERMLLYGSAGIMSMGNPAVAAAPAGLLGLRAFRATPPSMLDTLGAGAATLVNPYRRR
jgi:hypothetical protein